MRTHWLLRLTLAVALVAGWSLPAQAQGLTAEGTPGGPTIKDLAAEAELRGGLELLYDQVNNGADSGIVSQYNPDGSPAQNWDAVAADNFVVFEGTTWTVERVFVRGFYGPSSLPNGTCAEAEVGIWSSAGTAPDAPLFVYDVAPATDNAGALTINIPATELAEGNYWLSVVCSGPNLVFDVPGNNVRRWNWYYGPPAPIGPPAVLQNLGTGFGIPPGWNPLPTIGVAQQNLSFALFGQMEGEPPPPPPGPNFFEDFNTVATGGLPKGWTRFNVGGVTATQWGGVTAFGSGAMRSNWSSGVADWAEDYLVTPAIELGPDAELSFRAAKGFALPYSSEYAVLVSTTVPDQAGAFTPVYEFLPDAIATVSNGGTYLEVDLSAYADQTVYIAFWHRQDDDGNTLTIDDVAITWTTASEEGPAASFSPSVATGLTVELSPGQTGEGTVTITNIGDEPLQYAFADFARAAQRGDAQVIYSQDFEGAFPPAGWNNSNAINGCPWLSSDDYPMPGFTGTSRGAAIDSDECFTSANPGPGDASLISPTIDLTGVTGAMLNFDFAYRHLGSSSTTLGVSTDGGATWTTLQSWTASFGLPASANVMVDLSAYDGQQIQLRWRYQSGWDWWAFVDNVVVSGMGGSTGFVTSVSPVSGTIAPGQSQQVTVAVSAAGLNAGTYETTLSIETNEDNGSYDYPVTLVVAGLDAPIAGVDVTELSFTLPPDAEGEASIVLSNTAGAGSENLEFCTAVVEARPVFSPVDFSAPMGFDRAAGIETQGTADAEVLPLAQRGGAPNSLSEGFANITTLPAAGWALINRSAPIGTTGWFQGNPEVFPSFSGPPNAYIGANFNSTAGSGTISNWLITPELTINNGTELRFYTRTGAGSQWGDRLQVRLSTAGGSTNVGTTATSVGDFTQLLLDINPTYVPANYPPVWTEYVVTVSGLAGPTTGRFAFRYFVENGGPTGANSNFIGIDEVSVAGPSGPIAVSPDCGSIAPGESETITVSVNTAGLADGTYEYDVLITTNDPANPTLAVAVTLVVGDVSTETTAPATFALLQNYPNPFAGSTTLEFMLPESAPVTLEVFDVAGRRIATLVDAEMPAGTHRVQWDANGLASGTYLYRIQAGSFQQSLRALVVN